MSKLPWFRMYTEAVDDDRLRLLAFEDRWHYVALLCCKGAGLLDDKGPLLHRRVAVKLGVQLRELDEITRRLAEVGLIDAATFEPIAWERRQYASDHDRTAKERQRRAREKRKASGNAPSGNVTDASRVSHGHVTTLDTDTDTDTDQKQDQELYAPKGAPATAQTPKAKARRQEPQAPAGVSPQTWADFLAVRKAKRLPMTQSALDGIEREAAKVGMTLAQAIERCAQDGWAGFKASWIERERGERIAAIAGQRHVMPEKSKRRQAIENLEAFANGTYTDPYSATLANADADPWAERSGLLVLGGNTSG